MWPFVTLCQRKVEMSYSPQSRNVRFWPGWEEVPVSLNVIREGVAPNVEIQGRGDDGAGSEESIGTQPSDGEVVIRGF